MVGPVLFVLLWSLRPGQLSHRDVLLEPSPLPLTWAPHHTHQCEVANGPAHPYSASVAIAKTASLHSLLGQDELALSPSYTPAGH